MEIYVKNLQKAEEKINKIEKLIVLSQVSKNKKLMLITLEEIEKALKDCISSALHFDFKLKRVKLYKDPHLNLKTFRDKSSKNFFINPQELNMINEVLLASK